jgi:hypothetical protein
MMSYVVWALCHEAPKAERNEKQEKAILPQRGVLTSWEGKCGEPRGS